MTRIAIVSNRLPSLDRDEASAGGLAVGLSASLEDAGGTWLGWDGTVASAPDGAAHIQQSAPYNRDGSDANYSANCGRAGPTADRTVEDVKIHQTKNMLATLFLSRRVPMLLGGDEFRRTQNGNNNAYCQDNAVSWYDWRLLDANREVFPLVRELGRASCRERVCQAG